MKAHPVLPSSFHASANRHPRPLPWLCFMSLWLAAAGFGRPVSAQDATSARPAETAAANAAEALPKVLHVVATSHLDTQWLWTIQDTINQYIPLTLRENFARFEKHPNYVFSFEGAFRYMLTREYYPEDYARMKQYIAAGRWHVCGSTVDACDVNIPSPESLIRQTLYGNGFFRREFGKTSCDIFLPDCFGFGYALPAVAAHCGLKGFSTQKLTWGSSVGIPFDIGVWEGVDGSTLTAAVNPGAYVAQLREDLSHSKKWLEAIEKLEKEAGLPLAYRYFGVGDTGGAPDDESVAWLERSIAGNGPIRVLSVPADRIHRELTPAQAARLPRYRGELLMTRHGTGCYTSQAAMKRWNRQNEQLADAAERAAVIADWLGGSPYPREKLTEAWVRFLWHQFHDDLTGTSVPEAYTFSWNDEILSLNQFAEVLTNSAGVAARALDTRVEGVPVVVFNPLAMAREDVVEAAVTYPSAAPKAIRVFDPSGAEVPSQVLAAGPRRVRVAFLARVPSVGYCVFDVRASDSPCALPTGLKAAESLLENERYRLTVDAGGDVAAIFDKQAGRDLLAAPHRLELIEDRPAQWSEWEIQYEDLLKGPRVFVAGPAHVRVVECGPVRATLEVVRHADGSTFRQRIRLAAGGAGDRVEFDTTVDWRTPRTLLKAAFPLAVSSPLATYDLGLGTIQRGNNTDKLYEVPAQQWADLTAEDGGYGVAVMSDCKYGWDKPGDNLLRLTLIHSPHQVQKDMGHHRLTYAVTGHSGGWRQAGVVGRAARLNQPLRGFQTRPAEGRLGKTFSMLSCGHPQVAVQAVKKAEESDEVVFRLQELWGEPAEGVRIHFAAPILAAREVTGEEQPVGFTGGLVQDGELVVDLLPYRPRAFAVTLGPPPVRLAPPTCQTVEMPFDTDVVSTDADRTDGDFDGQGRSMPAELFPPTLTVEGIPFAMGSSAPRQFNAVTCRGQTIDLPAGNWNRLYLLAAAVGDVEATFRIGGAACSRRVQDWTGFVGQSQSLVVDGQVVDAVRMSPPFIKRDPVAWVGTHRHHRLNGNEAYRFCYWFKYGFDLPAGARTLTLPADARIKVAAATVALNENDDVTAAGDLYDAVAAVRMSPAGGLAIDPLEVTLSTDQPGAEIRYTVDGSEPTRAALRYIKPLRLAATATVKARVFTDVGEADPTTTGVFTFVEPRSADRTGPVEQGLTYKYYEGVWSAVPETAAMTPVAAGLTDGVSLEPRGREAHFALKLQGYLEVPRTGVYTLFLSSDDGSKLYLGDRLLIDHDGLHGMIERGESVALTKGRHAVTLVMFQRGGDHGLALAWEGPGIPKQPVPAAAWVRDRVVR